MPNSQMPPAGTHTMPGGQQMPGGQMPPAAPTATTAPATDAEMATCLVTGETMPKDKMIPYEYQGKTYYFCCAPCLEKFKADPEKWIKESASAAPSDGQR